MSFELLNFHKNIDFKGKPADRSAASAGGVVGGGCDNYPEQNKRKYASSTEKTLKIN